jgi:hypothetical protein
MCVKLQIVKRQFACVAMLLLTVLLVPRIPARAQGSPPATADDTLRQYVELRLRWAEWKDYSRFITWPDEPGWDCWWVAKNYRIGSAVHKGARSVIPVTYARLGLFCADFQLDSHPRTETIHYELVRKGGMWKVDRPVPDYPYISAMALEGWLTKIIADTKETSERRTQAQHALEELTAAKRRR